MVVNKYLVLPDSDLHIYAGPRKISFQKKFQPLRYFKIMFNSQTERFPATPPWTADDTAIAPPIECPTNTKLCRQKAVLTNMLI